ncbi:MAG: GspE/PulE family protein [bacterium]
MDLEHAPDGASHDASATVEEGAADSDTDLFASFVSRLTGAGTLDEAALERARTAARKSGERLDLVLTRLGIVPESEVAAAWADVMNLPLVEAAGLNADPAALERFNLRFLKKFRVLPLATEDGSFAFAVADPLDAYAAQALAYVVGAPVERRVAAPGDVDRALRALEAEAEAPSPTADTYGDDPGEADVARLRDIASEAPVIKLVNGLISRAVEAGASDIHVEPSPGRLRVRFRIDGMLRDVDAPPPGLGPAVASRIKIMAGLDIAERRRPQDGRARLAVQGRDVDLRVATTPTVHGETIVLRILDRSQVKLDFEALGFSGPALKTWRGILNQPHGILLTGPTGSGKTTTLYASLRELNAPERKIFTVEDPVEYQLEGVSQIQVKPDIGLTFAHVLRSVLRQDPDVIMVGEIRDLETAEIAIQAALTGHLVLATLHTNSAASSITRLVDMGIEDYLIASTVLGVAAQRLVRRLCRACAQSYTLLPDMTARLGLDPAGGPHTAWRATGCEACRNTGFSGRMALMEVLPVSDAVREHVLHGAGETAIERTAVDSGMRTMFRHGVELALEGKTTIDEVLRVTRAAA